MPEPPRLTSQKSHSRPRPFIKVCGCLVIAAIGTTRSIGHYGLFADLGGSTASSLSSVRQTALTAQTCPSRLGSNAAMRPVIAAVRASCSNLLAQTSVSGQSGHLSAAISLDKMMDNWLHLWSAGSIERGPENMRLGKSNSVALLWPQPQKRSNRYEGASGRL